MQVVTKQNLANFTEKLLENDKKVLNDVKYELEEKDKVDAITEVSESEMNEIFTNAYNKVFGSI